VTSLLLLLLLVSTIGASTLGVGGGSGGGTVDGGGLVDGGGDHGLVSGNNRLVGGNNGLVGSNNGLVGGDGGDVVDGGDNGGVSGVSHLGDESALAINVVLDGADSAVGLHQTVLSLGLVSLTGFLVRVDVVGVVVVDGVLVRVVGLVSLKNEFLLGDFNAGFLFLSVLGRVRTGFLTGRFFDKT